MRDRALPVVAMPYLLEGCNGHEDLIFSCQKNRNPIKGQGVLPCLLFHYLLPGNLKPANKAVHGTNHAKHLESLDFRCTVWRTGTASGIGTTGFHRRIEMIGPSVAANRPVGTHALLTGG